MTSVNPTSSTLGTEPLNPPAGIKLETPEQEQVYRASLEFERFFVQQLLKPMENAGSMGGEEEGGTGATGGYKDMAQDQLTDAVLGGGGLGIAASLYTQMAEAAGVLTAPAATTPAPTTATPRSAGGDA